MSRIDPRVARLAVLSGALYFVQGMGDPTEGLIAQPVQSVLRRWGSSPAELATFAALVALPWSFKPIYGLLSDYVPIRGSRRRAWLVLSGLATFVAGTTLALVPLQRGDSTLLLVLCAAPTVAVAFSDVVVDAMTVARGQPLDATGTLQSVQWTCSWAATIVTGHIGGMLSQASAETTGFAICGALGLVTVLLAWAAGPDTPEDIPEAGARQTTRALFTALKSPSVRASAGYMFLVTFNPFTNAVLYAHMTAHLGLGESIYGTSVSVLAIASALASLAYAFYCRRVSQGALLHLSVILASLSTLLYVGVEDSTSALVVAALVGVTSATANLAQLDAVARTVPPQAAASVFASLMAIANLGGSMGTYVGGHAYERLRDGWGADHAFDGLVVVGAATTLLAWLFVPTLRRSIDA